MYIDTHNHLTYRYHSEEYLEAVLLARKAGVAMQILMSGSIGDFDAVRHWAHQARLSYMLGLHPLMIDQITSKDEEALQAYLVRFSADLRLIGIGEIGLDRYMEQSQFERQKALFIHQMQLAEQYMLPVSVHSRRALSFVLDIARAFPTVKGVFHAFKGSLEQTRQAIDLGWKLGIGGAVTYEGSKAVRALVKYADIESLVLETDAPDMAPAGRYPRLSDPTDILSYVKIMAEIKNLDPMLLQHQLLLNTLNIFPRLGTVLKEDEHLSQQVT